MVKMFYAMKSAFSSRRRRNFWQSFKNICIDKALSQLKALKLYGGSEPYLSV